METGWHHDQSHWSFTREKDHDWESRQENYASQQKTQIVISFSFSAINVIKLNQLPLFDPNPYPEKTQRVAANLIYFFVKPPCWFNVTTLRIVPQSWPVSMYNTGYEKLFTREFLPALGAISIWPVPRHNTTLAVVMFLTQSTISIWHELLWKWQ